jgi:hypothetical protein
MKRAFDEDRCAWKRCRSTDTMGACVGTDRREYWICWRHHVELCGMEGSVSENILSHVAKTARGRKEDDEH